MSDRTPETHTIREGYVRLMAEVGRVSGRPEPVDTHYAEFDHWLTQHEAELRNQIAADIEHVVDTLWNRSSTGFAGWEQIVALVRGDQPGRADQ